MLFKKKKNTVLQFKKDRFCILELFDEIDSVALTQAYTCLRLPT